MRGLLRTPVILLNGEPAATLDALDRGLHYGDGVFETIAVHNGVPLLWERHLARLGDGCRRLRIPEPDEGVLREEVARLSADGATWVAKVVITRGTGGRGYRAPAHAMPTRLVFSCPWPAYPDHYRERGVAVRLCRTPLSRNPALAGMKHLNRMEQVLARSEWSGEEPAEGLMVDTGGNLVEGTMSNLFLVAGGRVTTPPVEQCGVAGVMRAQVIETAARLGIAVEVSSLSVADAMAGDALFLTNSLLGLWPVRQFEERTYGSHPLVQRLMQQLVRERACV